MNLYFLMGLEMRQLDSVQKAPLVCEEGEKAPQSSTDSDLFWTTGGENTQQYLENWGTASY